MEHNFKVGDKVKILPRDSCMSRTLMYVDDMLRFVGNIETVIKVQKSSIELTNTNGYFWPLDVLELVESADSKEGREVHPSELKEGDYIKISSRLSDNPTFIYIFKKYVNDAIYRYASFNITENMLFTDPYSKWDGYSKSTVITYATPEEKKLLDDALLEKGYIWDNTIKKLIQINQLSLDAGIVDIHTTESVLNTCGTTVSKPCLTSVDTTKTPEEELNLFPTKKHYQLNFNY